MGAGAAATATSGAAASNVLVRTVPVQTISLGKDGEKRESRLVFIGRNLDEEKLRRTFEACQAA